MQCATPEESTSYGVWCATVALTPSPQVEVRVSAHAVHRYQERVRAALDPENAIRELVILIAVAELRSTPPHWIGPTDQRPAFYLCLADLAMPADPDNASRDRLVIRTVLTLPEPAPPPATLAALDPTRRPLSDNNSAPSDQPRQLRRAQRKRRTSAGPSRPSRTRRTDWQ